MLVKWAHKCWCAWLKVISGNWIGSLFRNGLASKSNLFFCRRWKLRDHSTRVDSSGSPIIPSINADNFILIICFKIHKSGSPFRNMLLYWNIKALSLLVSFQYLLLSLWQTWHLWLRKAADIQETQVHFFVCLGPLFCTPGSFSLIFMHSLLSKVTVASRCGSGTHVWEILDPIL